jgi:hypothetical protein
MARLISVTHHKRTVGSENQRNKSLPRPIPNPSMHFVLEKSGWCMRGEQRGWQGSIPGGAVRPSGATAVSHVQKIDRFQRYWVLNEISELRWRKEVDGSSKQISYHEHHPRSDSKCREEGGLGFNHTSISLGLLHPLRRIRCSTQGPKPAQVKAPKHPLQLSSTKFSANEQCLERATDKTTRPSPWGISLRLILDIEN